MNYFIDNLQKENKGIKFQKIEFWKIVLVNLLLVAGFVIFLFQIVNLQVLKGKTYSAQSYENFESESFILPERGIIYSRNEEPLVKNSPQYAVVIDLILFNRFTNYTNVNEFLSSREQQILRKYKIQFGADQIEDFNEALSFGKDHYVLKTFYEPDSFLPLESDLSSLDDTKIKIITQTFRNYVKPSYYSHVLGYTRSVSEEDLKSNSWYTPNSKIGALGIESSYEKYLRGEKGIEEKIYSSNSSVISKKVLTPPSSGNSVVTTINTDLQEAGFESLKNMIEETDGIAGSVVVQNPKTGEVLSLVSYPSFNSNLFSKGISESDYNSYLDSPLKPMLNRAISAAFPPASTFKIVTSSAGLEEDKLDVGTFINDPGIIRVGEFSYKTWKDGGHGRINIIGALKESSDTFFYILGGGHPDFPQIEEIGPWGIYKWARLFGMGQKLGIDIPGESTGFVPNPEWKQENINEKWFIGNTYHFSIGQGYLTTTLLQVNSMISAIANDGLIYKPYLVKNVFNEDTGEVVLSNKPEVLHDINVSQENIDIIKEGLVQAVSTGGTAYPLFDYPISVAGKTGTAEFGTGDSTHAWFTAFAPVEDPEIVVTVFIEAGGGGSDTAAPVVKDVFDEYFGINE